MKSGNSLNMSCAFGLSLVDVEGGRIKKVFCRLNMKDSVEKMNGEGNEIGYGKEQVFS